MTNVDVQYEQLIQGGCLAQGNHLAFQVAQFKDYPRSLAQHKSILDGTSFTHTILKFLGIDKKPRLK